MLNDKATYTLWIDDQLVATGPHTRETYNDLLAEAAEAQGNVLCEIYSSRDDEAVWQSDREVVPMTYEETYGWDASPEAYEPNPYDGTYSEM